MQIKEEVLAYVRETYHVDIEYLWKKSPGNGIFRHADNRKWFAALLIAKKKSLGLSEEGDLDLLNVKVGDAYLLDTLAGQEGFFPWLSHEQRTLAVHRSRWDSSSFYHLPTDR